LPVYYFYSAANVSRRDYQFFITKIALFTNTLVALPTGLGKTFIAAVVMLNYFRWFPEGKVKFDSNFHVEYSKLMDFQ
jgi:ERCC4-related helicase